MIEYEVITLGLLIMLVHSLFGLILPYYVTRKEKGLIVTIHMIVNIVLHYMMLLFGFYYYYVPCEGWECLNRIGVLVPFYLSLPVFLVTTLIYWIIIKIIEIFFFLD